jgi:hypothetical protein
MGLILNSTQNIYQPEPFEFEKLHLLTPISEILLYLEKSDLMQKIQW